MENEELKRKLYVKEELEKERKDNDDRYAAKIFERILWALLAAILVALVSFTVTKLFGSAKVL